MDCHILHQIVDFHLFGNLIEIPVKLIVELHQLFAHAVREAEVLQFYVFLKPAQILIRSLFADKLQHGRFHGASQKPRLLDQFLIQRGYQASLLRYNFNQLDL